MSENQTESQPLERLTIWPHRSLSPKGFAIVIGVLAGLLFAIGLGFFLAGAWPVIGFLGLELLVVWGAFKLNYRAAKVRETIETTTETLTVEHKDQHGKAAVSKYPSGLASRPTKPASRPRTGSPLSPACDFIQPWRRNRDWRLSAPDRKSQITA